MVPLKDAGQDTASRLAADSLNLRELSDPLSPGWGAGLGLESVRVILPRV